MILKTTFKDGQVLMEDLGDRFLLTSKQRTPNKFEEIYTSIKLDNKDCYGFISSLRMETDHIPIYTDMYYSVLSERGCEVMELAINRL